MQCDDQGVDARFLAPLLLKAWNDTYPDPQAFADQAPLQAALTQLKAWVREGKFSFDSDCEPCSIYTRWADRLSDRWNVNSTALYKILSKRSEPGNLERMKSALSTELNIVLEELGPKHHWADIHLAFFPHLIGNQLYEKPPLFTPGGLNSVNAGESIWYPGDPARQLRGFYHHTVGASQRLLVKLSSPPEVYSVLAGPNQDVERLDMVDSKSPYMDWLHCHLFKRKFPLDWDQVSLSQISF